MQTEVKNNLITALPVFLIGFGITVSCLIAGGACYETPSWRLHSGIVFGGLIALSIGILGIVGLVKRIPDWSIIWISVSIIGFLVLLNFLASLGLPDAAELLLLSISSLAALFVFYMISIKSWQNAGLFGLGLSVALSMILFFLATNISHDEIKTAYYTALIGLLMSGLIYWYLIGSNRIKIAMVFLIMIFNGFLIYIFDSSMVSVNEESQLYYLLSLSAILMLSGLILHFAMRFIKFWIDQIRSR